MNSIGNAILQHIGVSPVAEGTNKSTGKQSVFEHGYIPTSDAATLSLQGKAYFRGPNSIFWEMVISEFSEEHAEKYALHDTHSHTYLMHAMGSQPINVHISGYLASGRDVDHRVQFLKRYFEEFTPRVTDRPNYDLQVVIKHTTFNMLITQMSVNESNELEDFTSISIEGLAFNYNQDNGDKLLYEYDNQLHIHENTADAERFDSNWNKLKAAWNGEAPEKTAVPAGVKIVPPGKYGAEGWKDAMPGANAPLPGQFSRVTPLSS